MKLFKVFSILVLLFFPLQIVSANQCPKKDKSLWILTPLSDFQKSPIDFAAPFFLHHYLSHLLKNISIVPLSSITPQEKTAVSQAIVTDYSLEPRLKIDKKTKSFEGALILTDSSMKTLASLPAPTGKLKSTSDIHEFILASLEPILKALGDKLDKKAAALTLTAQNAETYLPYLQAEAALGRVDAKNAMLLFDEAIKKDYNFVPAYLGKAEAAAILSITDARYEPLAKKELLKAKLLNPPLTEFFEKKIETILKKKKVDPCL